MINNKNSIFVAAFDDRHLLPYYFNTFIRNTTKYCHLNLITPKKNLNIKAQINFKSKYKLNLIDPSNLPQYLITKKLFNKVFINYSTNKSYFEKACFYRWFALNAATAFLGRDEIICLLDTDLLIGMEPKDILSSCISNNGNKKIQFIAEWDEDNQAAFGPEITIMTKSYLFGFCKFLITTYYSSEMRSKLLGEYFDRIGNGNYGGICDMRALATYARNYKDKIFNLRKLENLNLIRNFNCFLKENDKRDDWKICFEGKNQILVNSYESKRLIGIHFQGDAKFHMHLLDKHKKLTKRLIFKNMKSYRTFFIKKLNLLNNFINLFIRFFKKN